MTCQHHWLIETSNGPVSPGTCCRCGATGKFNNVIDLEYGKDAGGKKGQSAEIVKGRKRHRQQTIGLPFPLGG